jgi:hypothetical protein
MVHLKVADGEDWLQVRRVEVTALNNQSLIVDKGWFARLMVEKGLLELPHKSKHVTGPQMWRDSLDTVQWFTLVNIVINWWDS